MAKDTQPHRPRYCCDSEEYLELMEACEQLKPILRKRVEETNRRRQLTVDTCNDIKLNRLAKILQPRIFSGLEAPLESMGTQGPTNRKR